MTNDARSLVGLYHCCSILLCALFLASCSGGDGTPLNSNEAQASGQENGYRLRVGLYRNSDGTPTNFVSANEPGVIIASLTRFGSPEVSQVINFSTNLGILSPALGTALTDSSGEASIRLLPGSLEGAGTITATVPIPGSLQSLTVKLNFSVTTADTGPAQDVDINLSFTSTSGTANTVRVDAPGTLTATVLSQSGLPLSNAIVSFASTLVSFDPVSASAITNDNGVASITVNAGDSTGVTTITATVQIGTTPYTESINVTVSPPNIKLGSGTGDNFQQGLLGFSVNPLSAGGTASVSVRIVDENNQPFSEPLSVAFTSPCVTQQLASIDAQVTSINGLATATYRASGCVGSDKITATLNFGGIQFLASADLIIADDNVGSIAFVNANPSTIVLQGAGGQGLVETSTVSFQVFGTQGLPIANQQVDFSLTSSVGGISFTPASATTDANGLVSTQVQSGSISTTVVVIATLTDAGISTQSGLLVISTGVPDQDSMTIAIGTLNPEAWIYNGETVSVTAYAADQFNNPVPNGVSLSFTTEGGIIEPSCTVMNGQCSVTWTSQNPRPINGLVTIMVSATGSESFQDENGNGVFDDGDILSDLTEAFRDDNWNGTREAGEPYVDFNVNGVFDLADGVYGGPTCEHSSLCGSSAGVTVWDQAQMVMSTSKAVFTVNQPNGSTYSSGEPINITIADQHGNSMPIGSEVSIETENGTLNLQGFTIENTLDPWSYTLTVIELDPTLDSAVITIGVVTPKGHSSSYTHRISY